MICMSTMSTVTYAMQNKLLCTNAPTEHNHLPSSCFQSKAGNYPGTEISTYFRNIQSSKAITCTEKYRSQKHKWMLNVPDQIISIAPYLLPSPFQTNLFKSKRDGKKCTQTIFTQMFLRAYMATLWTGPQRPKMKNQYSVYGDPPNWIPSPCCQGFPRM